MHAHKTVLVLLAAALAGLTACSGGAGTAAPAAAVAQAEDAEATQQGVTVEAVGTVEGTPDVLTALVGVQVEADDVDGAYTQSNAAAAAVRDALLDAGVDAADVQTARLSLRPAHRRGPDGEEPDGYVARTELRVDLRDLEAAGSVLDQAVAAADGHATLRSLGFSLDDDSDLAAAAREAAFEEARAKAEQYADLADRSLGPLVGLAEAAGLHGPIPEPVAPVAEADVAAGPPVEPGQEAVQVRIRATWALQ